MFYIHVQLIYGYVETDIDDDNDDDDKTETSPPTQRNGLFCMFIARTLKGGTTSFTLAYDDF